MCDSNAIVIDFELEEFGIVDLSDDDVGVNPTILWRDDIDHYVEIDGSLLPIEHRTCSAPNCSITTQLVVHDLFQIHCSPIRYNIPYGPVTPYRGFRSRHPHVVSHDSL